MENIVLSRVATVNKELLAAMERLIPQLTTAPIPTMDDLYNLIRSSSVLIIARAGKENNKIVGAGTLAVFRTPSGVHAHVEDVIVDEDFRGQGLGQAIVLHLLQIARLMGLDGVSLTCNPRRIEANHLYQKMGFKKWDTNSYWYVLE